MRTAPRSGMDRPEDMWSGEPPASAGTWRARPDRTVLLGASLAAGMLTVGAILPWATWAHFGDGGQTASTSGMSNINGVVTFGAGLLVGVGVMLRLAKGRIWPLALVMVGGGAGALAAVDAGIHIARVFSSAGSALGLSSRYADRGMGLPLAIGGAGLAVLSCLWDVVSHFLRAGRELR